MKKNKNRIYSTFCVTCICLGVAGNSFGIGLRSFVALPIDKNGVVLQLAIEHAKDADTDRLTTSAAYGFSARQTLLLDLPYRLSPAGNNRQGDVSVLYRHIVVQDDYLSGSDRIGILAGAIVPTDSNRDSAIQAGFVFTRVKNRHEIDIDALYQAGMKSRVDSGRYDASWQYRLIPSEWPEWGFSNQLNSALELNGRWSEGNNVTHQITAGLQWIHQNLVIEGGLAKDLNNANETRYLISTRYRF